MAKECKFADVCYMVSAMCPTDKILFKIARDATFGIKSIIIDDKEVNVKKLINEGFNVCKYSETIKDKSLEYITAGLIEISWDK